MLFFATEVERASGGTVKVEPIDDEQADVDNDNRVASGEIDAAITQARSWDALDVTSLQALQTPFLVTNEAAAAVATDGELAERLMSGLTAKGVDGLALWAIDFRHPVSFGEPFLSLADFKDAKIRIVGSTVTEQVMAALGAEAVRPEGEWLDQIKDGTIKGAESAFDRVATLPRVGTMTGNVTFYPRVDAFFVNHAVFSKLSATQQAAIRDAAAATRRHVIDGIVPDATQAAGYCSVGGTVVLAEDTDVDGDGGSAAAGPNRGSNRTRSRSSSSRISRPQRAASRRPPPRSRARRPRPTSSRARGTRTRSPRRRSSRPSSPPADPKPKVVRSSPRTAVGPRRRPSSASGSTRDH